jgi:hypothetical protein
MTLIEFKKNVFERPPDLANQLYDYGFSCGMKNIINFEIVQQVFYIYNYPEKDRLECMRKILKGFQDGCRKK